MKTCLALFTFALAITAVLCIPSFSTKTTCERRTAYLKCQTGYTISIIMAKYGRTDRATCPSKSIRTTHCSSTTSLSIVKRSCNGRKDCKVRATNNVFGDPCRGTHKYLRIKYVCRKTGPTGITRSITCEKKKTTLSCRRGRVLDIVSANYGRSDPNTCQHKSIRTTNCASKQSFYKIRAQCQGDRSCRLYASNSVYGDPCRGTYKYLDVKYRCVVDPHHNDTYQ